MGRSWSSAEQQLFLDLFAPAVAPVPLVWTVRGIAIAPRVAPVRGIRRYSMHIYLYLRRLYTEYVCRAGGRVVNVPQMLIVEGDLVLLRPGYPVPFRCLQLSEDVRKCKQL